jgi:RND family efflux transporter MFP subunit
MIEFPAIEGAIIEAGALVAKLDQEPFQLALDRAIASQEKSQRDLKRLQRLKANASQAQVDGASTALVLADLAVRDARLALQRSTLNAPFAALVANRITANYSTVGAGTPIARLHDMSELHIEIEVPEVLVQQLGDNPNVELTATFPASDQTFALSFREVIAEASRIGQTFTVTLGMSPPDDLLLLPGATATVRATLMDQATGMIVPASAIHTAASGDVSVMRFVQADNGATVVMTPVEIELNHNGAVQITSGLESGSEIVAAGVNSLRDGQAVRRFESF